MCVYRCKPGVNPPSEHLIKLNMLILLIKMVFCGRCKRVNAEIVGEVIRRIMWISRHILIFWQVLGSYERGKIVAIPPAPFLPAWPSPGKSAT
jgi:hypothetical protein